MIADPREDVRLGWPVVLAMDMHLQAPGNLTPAPDPRLAPTWRILGYITGEDALLRPRGTLALGGVRTCYGLLLAAPGAPGAFLVAIRGTAGILEWVEDGEFALTAYPLGKGLVEAGFWGVYRSLCFLGAEAGATEEPLLAALTRITAQGFLTVVGHSLGAALATYLTLDLTETPGLRVRGRFFASPRPGNGAFADLFDRSVADYVSYARALDVVPHVPLGLGYTPLHNLVVIRPDSSQARIGFGAGCGHHLVCYLADLDYAFTNWRAMPAIDQDNAACIKGPALLGDN